MKRARTFLRFLPLIAMLAMAGTTLAQPRKDQPGQENPPERHNRPGDPNPPGRPERNGDPNRRPDDPRGRGDRDAPHHSPQENDRRYRELEERRHGGRLGDNDKPEWTRLSERQTRIDELNRQVRARNDDRGERRRVTQARHRASYVATRHDPRAVEEWQTHARRSAQLARAIDIATAEGRNDARQRAEELTAREEVRHIAWVAAHTNGAH